MALLPYAAIIPSLLTGQQMAQDKPTEHVYHDAEFGFSFSYPEGVKSAKTIPMDYGRCIHMEAGNVVITACGVVLAWCVAGITKGVTAANLKGAFEQWQSEVKTFNGTVKDSRFGTNWFVGESVGSPALSSSPNQIGIRKTFVGGCLQNYLSMFVSPEKYMQSHAIILQVGGSFHPGEMDMLPPLSSRQDWESKPANYTTIQLK
jgi:hypothetical protein